MDVIVTANSPSIDSEIDPRFGRGKYFIAVNTDTLEWQAYSNPGVNAQGGAGTLAAQFVANKKANAVISGDFGPNAIRALQAAGISMYLLGTRQNVREAVEHLIAGQLEQAGEPKGTGV
jgi:predicted Fe-Mo cluster-binding NifX family protein